MAEKVEDGALGSERKASIAEQVLSSSSEDYGVIPKGTIDPVYEAKARVLNNAVG